MDNNVVIITSKGKIQKATVRIRFTKEQIKAAFERLWPKRT